MVHLLTEYTFFIFPYFSLSEWYTIIFQEILRIISEIDIYTIGALRLRNQEDKNKWFGISPHQDLPETKNLTCEK